MIKASASWVVVPFLVLTWGAGVGAQPPTDRGALGLGMVDPKPTPGKTLQLFGPPPVGTPALAAEALAEVTFVEDPFGDVGLGSAPPWLLPEVLKLEYNLLLFRAVTLTERWIEVVVNRESGRTAWVERSGVELLDWPAFLLQVFSIRVDDPRDNPIRLEPSDESSPVPAPQERHYRVLAVRDGWMRVASGEPTARPEPIGWVRWRRGDRLVIQYFMLS